MSLTPPTPWPIKKLEEVVQILDGRRVPVNARERASRSGDVPYYGATGQVGWIDAALFDEDLVLLGEDGAPFLELNRPKAYCISGPAWVNNHAHVLRAQQVTSRFLLHFLNTVDYRPFVNGTTRLKLTQGSMREIPIPVPPLEEQVQIVDTIEQRIGHLDIGNQHLIHATRLIDAFQRATRDRLIAELSVPRVSLSDVGDPNIRAITDGPFGSNLTSAHYTRSGPRVIRLQNIGVGEFLDERAHISQAHFESLRAHSVEAGDVLVAILGDPPPRACVVPDSVGLAIVKADCVRIRVRAEFNPRFVMHWLNSASAREQSRSLIHGVGRQRLRLSSLRTLQIPAPTLDEQNRIADRLGHQRAGLDRVLGDVSRAQGMSNALRPAILDAAFTGHLDLAAANLEAESMLAGTAS